MIYLRRIKCRILLLLFLFLQSAPIGPVSAFSTNRKELSQNSLGFSILRSGIWHGPEARRVSAFVRAPIGVESRVAFPRLRPNRESQALHALHGDSDPTNGNENPGASNIFGRIWNGVKRLFGAGDMAGVPLVTGLTKLPATHVAQMLPMQSMRSLQSLNLPVTLQSADSHPTTAQGAETSPYAQLIRAQPSVVMSKFLEKASQRVRDAAKSTVGALVGSFYRYCVETTMITSSDRLSVLIHSMQMTGYMLWNAECRYCLSQQLFGEPASKDSPQEKAPDSTVNKGKTHNVTPHLRDELVPPHNTDCLLWYIKKLPDDTANALFDNMTTGVLDAMHESTDMTVESLTGVAMNQQQPQAGTGTPPRVIVQQTGSSCIQLCFWHLALGYCLRDQEAKMELQNALKGT